MNESRAKHELVFKMYEQWRNSKIKANLFGPLQHQHLSFPC